MPKQITQAELRAVLDDESAVNRRMMQIRERIRKGATVEPGELGAFVEDPDDFSPECDSYQNMGLQIADAKSIEKYQSWRTEAERMRSKVIVIRGGNQGVAHA